MTIESLTPRVESRLPVILGSFQSKLQEIDALERRLTEKVAEKRVRALNILDELPAIRSSTLRIYVTHQFEQETQYVPVVAVPTVAVPIVAAPIVPVAVPVVPGVVPVPVPETPGATATAIARDPGTEATTSIPATPTPTPTENAPKKEIKVNKWKTIIEGKLLVSHLDHQSAAMIEQASKKLAKKDARIYQTQKDQQALDTADMTSRERTATRFMHDREGEEAITSIKFGHFFDRVSVTFETYQRDHPKESSSSAAVAAAAAALRSSKSGSTLSKRSKRSSFSAKAKKKKIPIPKQNQDLPAVEEYALLGRKTLCWNQLRATNPNIPNSPSQQTMDTHAFHAFHTEHSEPVNKENTVVATIRLHRKDLMDKYKPSALLCRVLLPLLPLPTPMPTPIPMPTPTPTPMSTPMPKATTVMNAQEISRTIVRPPSENDVQVPTLLTMDEALGAVHLYIRQKVLWKEDNASVIRNDKKMEELFGCKEMAIADVRQLLISRGLLIPSILGTPGDSPVVLTYIMKKETALKCKNGMNGNAVGKVSDSEENQKGDDEQNAKIKSAASISDTEEPMSKRRRTASTKEDTSDDAMEDVDPNMLSFDIDIDVAHLYHSKCRDILRRIKIREYEYTSCRTRALRTVEQTKASEDVIKERLENIVKQKGLTSGHQPVLAALAKEAPEGSEARIVAHLDARTALLVDRLETHCQQAHACWEIVNKCGGSV